MIFALAGNQNCGKTTLFNQLTGSNQHVGNFPGVTSTRNPAPSAGRRTAPWSICRASTRSAPTRRRRS